MTLDQIMMLLCDSKVLRAGSMTRTVNMEAMELVGLATDGEIKGIASDGSPMKARIGGRSLASMLLEQERAAKPPLTKREARLARKRAQNGN